MADADLSEEEWKELSGVLEGRHGKLKLIPVEGNRRAVIVKTTNEAAPLIRDRDDGLRVGGKELQTVLTSGAIGKLKRRASSPAANGKIHE
jgi:hypothetical protein